MTHNSAQRTPGATHLEHPLIDWQLRTFERRPLDSLLVHTPHLPGLHQALLYEGFRQETHTEQDTPLWCYSVPRGKKRHFRRILQEHLGYDDLNHFTPIPLVCITTTRPMRFSDLAQRSLVHRDAVALWWANTDPRAQVDFAHRMEWGFEVGRGSTLLMHNLPDTLLDVLHKNAEWYRIETANHQEHQQRRLQAITTELEQLQERASRLTAEYQQISHELEASRA